MAYLLAIAEVLAAALASFSAVASLGDLVEGTVRLDVVAIADVLADILDNSDVALDAELFLNLTATTGLLSGVGLSEGVGNLVSNNVGLGELGLRLALEAERVLVLRIIASVFVTAAVVANLEGCIWDVWLWAFSVELKAVFNVAVLACLAAAGWTTILWSLHINR